MGVAVALLLIGIGSSEAAEAPVRLDGTWVGTKADGQDSIWRVDEGRLRLDDRPADFEIRNDSLIVHFDPPPGATDRETAIYRFIASMPASGIRRLFIYGFDLGRQGVHLVREAEHASAAPEDAAPPAPESGRKPEPHEP